MEDLKTLIRENNHESILLLPSPEYNKYKTVAAISLEKYEEALLYASKNSFEQAYAYYKLKKFKKSLKILRKLSGKQVDVLKAQNLYFLGYFREADKLLSQYGSSDEFAVNLSAIRALNELNNQLKPSKFTSSEFHSKDNGGKILIPTIDYKFTDPECRMESEYNQLFRYIEDEKEYVRMLLDLQNKYNVENGCIVKQINNLLNEEIVNPTKKESEIISFNKGLVSEITNPILFQKHFINNIPTDYKLFKDYQLNKLDFISGSKSFEPSNQRLANLKALIISKRKQTPERKKRVLKTLKNNDSTIVTSILRLLSSDLSEDEFQQKALELIFKSSE